MDSHLIFSILKIWQETLCFIMLSTIESMGKVIHPKYYKHLKNGAHLGRQKTGLVSGRLACTSSKIEILNKKRT